MEKVTITLEYDPANGRVGIAAPLSNKVLCLGILSLATRLVQDFDPAKAQQQQQSALIVPRPGVNGFRG